MKKILFRHLKIENKELIVLWTIFNLNCLIIMMILQLIIMNNNSFFKRGNKNRKNIS